MADTATLSFPHHSEAERWLPVVGWEGLYEVSDLGRVRSLTRWTRAGMRHGRMLKLGLDPEGRPHASLCREGNQIGRRVCLLVLEAFVGPRPEGLECCHGPGGAVDNRLVNLSWDTKEKNNGPDKVRDGTDTRGERHPMAKLTTADVIEIRRRAAAGETQTALAREYGVVLRTVNDVVHRRRWSHLASAPGPVLPAGRPDEVGEGNAAAKLTWASVAEIRHRATAGETQRALASEFGVTQAAVWAVVAGKTWRNPPAA